MVQHSVYKIILQENNKFSAEYEAQDTIDSEINEDDLYEIYIMIFN